MQRRIRVTGLSLEFTANQTTLGTDIAQARAAIDQINLTLQRDPFSLEAKLLNGDVNGLCVIPIEEEAETV